MPVLAATTTAAALNSLNSLTAMINGGQLTWDILIILFLLFVSFIYGLAIGRDRIIVILMSIYMALVVITAAPWLDQLNPAQFKINDPFVFRGLVFLVIFLAILFLASKSALLAGISRSDAPGKRWQVILFSLLHVGLLASIILSFLPEEAQGQLAPITKQLFIGGQNRFFWIIAPIIGLALSRDHKALK